MILPPPFDAKIGSKELENQSKILLKLPSKYLTDF